MHVVSSGFCENHTHIFGHMFNPNTLTTQARCAEVVTEVNRTKSQLVARVGTTQVQLDDPSLANGLQDALQRAQNDYNTCSSGLAGLSEGPYRDSQLLKQHDLAKKVEQISQRMEEQGVHALLFKQLELLELQKRIEAMDELITFVEAHNLTLPPDPPGEPQ
jgi:hypothetical protein